ncbi:Phosphatidate cytidylyltransferase, mitochondrial, partial [Perkinsus olseni]
MTDLLVVTKDVAKFHELNLTKNPSHYAYPINKVKPKYLQSITRCAGGVYYNIGCTLQPGGLYCKYGIISHDDLCADLNNWNSLYIGGRLHKPVDIVYISDKKAYNEFTKALHYDRLSALRCALVFLLLLHNPQRGGGGDGVLRSIGTMEALLTCICSLSYMGDIRAGMVGAEDPNKIYNIVHGQAEELIHIYIPSTTIKKSQVHDYDNMGSYTNPEEEEDDDDGAPIVVDQWGNSLRPLRPDDLRHIEEEEENRVGDVRGQQQQQQRGGTTPAAAAAGAAAAAASLVLDEAVENTKSGKKKRMSQRIKLEEQNDDGIADDAAPSPRLGRIKEEYNDDEIRYDSDGDSDQSVVRGVVTKGKSPAAAGGGGGIIKQEDATNNSNDESYEDSDGDQSPIRRSGGVVTMSSGMTAGLVSGKDISKQMEDAAERRKRKLQQLPDE